MDRVNVVPVDLVRGDLTRADVVRVARLCGVRRLRICEDAVFIPRQHCQVAECVKEEASCVHTQHEGEESEAAEVAFAVDLVHQPVDLCLQVIRIAFHNLVSPSLAHFIRFKLVNVLALWFAIALHRT